MDTLLALALFLLSLFGFDTQRSVFVSHETFGGRDLLHARATLESGVAHFECIASASGLCYWTLFPVRCAKGMSPCTSPPLHRFALAVDDSRQVTGVSRARLCVSRAASLPPACHRLGSDTH